MKQKLFRSRMEIILSYTAIQYGASKQLVSIKAPHEAYKAAVSVNHQNPRNKKLFANLKQKMNKTRRLEWDEITNLHLLHYEMGTIQKKTTIPDLRVVSN